MTAASTSIIRDSTSIVKCGLVHSTWSIVWNLEVVHYLGEVIVSRGITSVGIIHIHCPLSEVPLGK